MPIIPSKVADTEIARRQKLVLEAMKQDGIDCLVMFNHSTWYPGPMKYVFDYFHQYPSGALLCPDVILHYGHVYFDPEIPENNPAGRLPEKRILYAPMVNATWANNWTGEQMLKVIKERGYKKIGIAGKQFVPAVIYQILTENLPDCEFSEFNHRIDEIRLSKSPYEIELLKEVCAIHDALQDDMANFLRPGLTGKEIINYGIKCAADRGCTEFNIMGGPYMPGGTSTAGVAGMQGNLRETVKGGYCNLMIECAGPYGHWSELSRLFSFGPPCDEVLQGVADAMFFQDEAARLCVPGADPQEIMDYINSLMVSRGYNPETRVCIHGQSTEIVDVPYFGAGDHTKLKNNQYLAIHPEAGNARLRCNITDNYLVTPNGAVRMMKSQREIIVL